MAGRNTFAQIASSDPAPAADGSRKAMTKLAPAAAIADAEAAAAAPAAATAAYAMARSTTKEGAPAPRICGDWDDVEVRVGGNMSARRSGV